MRVVLLSYDDYANLAYDQAESLKRIGIDAESFKLIRHSFGYEKQSCIVSQQQIVEEAKRSDVVIIMHSDLKITELVKPLNKKTAVWHTGSAYRAQPEKYNAIFNPFVFLTLTDQCEFMELGAKNIIYCAATIDVHAVPKFGHSIHRPYKIAHYPSNPEVKGTSKIIDMMLKVENEGRYYFEVSTNHLPHKEQLNRMNQCDIYIELFKPELRGKPYGCFGVTAFEAAAAGKVVITNNIHEKVYSDAYGYCALMICNTEEAFINKMEMLTNSMDDVISHYQTRSYEWMIRNHSYEANGTRLKQLLQID